MWQIVLGVVAVAIVLKDLWFRLQPASRRWQNLLCAATSAFALLIVGAYSGALLFPYPTTEAATHGAKPADPSAIWSQQLFDAQSIRPTEPMHPGDPNVVASVSLLIDVAQDTHFVLSGSSDGLGQIAIDDDFTIAIETSAPKETGLCQLEQEAGDACYGE